MQVQCASAVVYDIDRTASSREGAQTPQRKAATQVECARAHRGGSRRIAPRVGRVNSQRAPSHIQCVACAQCQIGGIDICRPQARLERAVVSEVGRVDVQPTRRVVFNQPVVHPTTSRVAPERAIAQHTHTIGNSHHATGVGMQGAPCLRERRSTPRHRARYGDVGRRTVEVQAARSNVEVHTVAQQQVLCQVKVVTRTQIHATADGDVVERASAASQRRTRDGAVLDDPTQRSQTARAKRSRASNVERRLAALQVQCASDVYHATTASKRAQVGGGKSPT